MRKNVFSNVAEREPKAAVVATPAADTPQSYPKHRQGKKALIAYFSPAVSKALRQMALDEDSTMQSLLGEAIDLLLRNRGKHPFGER
jgi:hypothetical protein